MITYQAENVRFPSIKKRETTAWIKAVADSYGKKVGEIGYLFCDDEKILEVNREYLGHDYYTDIITFDYDEGDTLNGDIVSRSTPSARMPNCSIRTTTKSCTASSSTACSTSAASTTRVPASAKSWKPPKTVPCPCGPQNNNVIPL